MDDFYVLLWVRSQMVVLLYAEGCWVAVDPTVCRRKWGKCDILLSMRASNIFQYREGKILFLFIRAHLKLTK